MIELFTYLKKDYNRHFSFNMAVTFFRIALVLAFAALIVLAAKLTYMPPLMKEEGVHSFTITHLNKYTVRHRRSTTTRYSAQCVDENGGNHNQNITSGEYATLVKGQTYERPMYSNESGSVFISWGNITDVKKATKEFYRRNPNATMSALNIGCIALGGLTFVSVLIGLGELRRERKYYNDTAIMRTGVQWDDYISK